MAEPTPDAADELMDLLRAVREAIDIPRAATTDGERVRAELVTARLIRVGVALRVLDEDPPSIGVATTTRW
ncbi:hypothetical protein AB0N61_17635, partial [Microbacterium sp. NPDC089320]|uniref:hypothetical protein n=1 Tax=Microbacterium sp. NPDC089320 TaxID=3155182 RepID=UPI003448AC42